MHGEAALLKCFVATGKLQCLALACHDFKVIQLGCKRSDFFGNLIVGVAGSSRSSYYYMFKFKFMQGGSYKVYLILAQYYVMALVICYVTGKGFGRTELKHTIILTEARKSYAFVALAKSREIQQFQ